MFVRLHRNHEGGDSAGTATADAAEAQAPDLSASEGSPAETPSTQTPSSETGTVSKGKQLAELLKKKPGYKATDEELDLLDAHLRGELKPEGDDVPEEEGIPEVKPKEAAKPPEASSLMKELNAKSEAEALENLKKLKAFTGSRDAQAYKALETKYQTLERDSKAEMALWNDLKAGSPKAIQYLESQLQAAKARAGIPAQPKPQEQGKKPFIDPSRFAVPEEAEALNSALEEHFGSFQKTIAEQAEIIRRLEEADRKRTEEHQLTVAQSNQLDEMLDVAGQIPEIKELTGLRDKFSEWLKGKDIPGLEVFDELFKTANSEKVSLKVAWKMMKADRLESQVAGAEDRGIQKAFKHKPNPSLSDMQGRGGITYTNYTDSQLKAMAAGRMEIPQEWFDKSDNLDKTKMPKRAIELLLANEGGD